MRHFKLGSVVQFPDGRIGTICWHHLDGYGGVWGRHDFSGIEPNFDDRLPEPTFMLREKDAERVLGKECVGEDCEVIG